MRIDRVGADGDGVARLPGGDPVFLPFTLPGESVSPAAPLTRRGDGWGASASTIQIASPERQEPPCPHFGPCGGCTLQHWQSAPYAAWKAGQFAAGLSRAGYTAEPTPLLPTPPGVRRRVDLALLRVGGTVRVGLHTRRSADVTDMLICLVLDPRLVAMAAALRRILPGLAGLRRQGSAVANLLDSGIDLLLRTDAALSAPDRVGLARLAEAAGITRIAWALRDGPVEPACQLGPSSILLGGVPVAPPPGAFLQASPVAEAAIVAAVVAGLPPRLGRAPVVELFAGCGTLTFALARHSRVVAYEGDTAAHAALRKAAAGKPVQPMLRDLARQPLTAKELAGAGCIVLDPPFAGAAAQMPAIAASGAERVVYVSCNPAALARDARPLHAAGYTLLAATPVDQFLWSAQVEGVAVFARARRPR